jgi:hypothetical protein
MIIASGVRPLILQLPMGSEDDFQRCDRPQIKPFHGDRVPWKEYSELPVTEEADG